MLAEMDHERVEAVIERCGLSRQTENTTTDREALYDELETVRSQG